MKLLVLKHFIYNQSEFQAVFMEIKGSLIALCLLHPAKILLSVLFRRALHTLGRGQTKSVVFASSLLLTVAGGKHTATHLAI